MPFVLDASIAASWCFPDENHPTATHALRLLGNDEAFAPVLWWFELRNVLVLGERRGRISTRGTLERLAAIQELDIRLTPLSERGDALVLARRHLLSFYDAAYLELALLEGLPLATLDGDLIRAARAERVPLVE